MANNRPTGAYTKVRCHDIQHVGGKLSGGTGTYNDGTFSCGPFDADDLPKVDSFYNLNGEHDKKYYEFPGWKCVHAGRTSDFRTK